MFIVTLFIIVKNWNNPNTHQQYSEQIVIYSYNGISYGNENELYDTNDLNASHKPPVV